jgi:type IV secretion system protein VirB10
MADDEKPDEQEEQELFESPEDYKQNMLNGMDGDEEAAEQFESTPDEATNTTGGGGPSFDRKKVLVTICVGFAVVVCGGLLFNIAKSAGGNSAGQSPEDRAASAPTGFLVSERERAERNAASGVTAVSLEDTIPVAPAQSVSRVEWVPQRQAPPVQSAGSGGQEGGGGGYRVDPLTTAYLSPLVPRIEGALFSGAARPAQVSQAPANQNPYAAALAQPGLPPDYYAQAVRAAGASGFASADAYNAQNAQGDKQAFAAQGGGGGGGYIPENALWMGTVIPGVMITGINTDLPGGILARTTENMYDSKTGKNLLIPQGTILIAKYNSSISYAQHRVQIVWDTLIRPDGFMLELESAAGVDAKGMSGIEAVYHENWFEYVKAAGIISMFTVANSRLAEEVNKYGSGTAAAGIAEANANYLTQVSGTIVSRSMNIQPTLTVDNGTVINIMLNKNMYLPPVPDVPVTSRYER